MKVASFRTSIALSFLSALALVAPTATAADRTVVCEEFTATWCVYCPPVGLCMSGLLDQHPDNFAFFQIHGDDSYVTTWGNTRMSFYGVPGYPTTVMDGYLRRIGQYGDATYISDFNARAAAPTDTAVTLTATQVSGATYNVNCNVAIDPGGAARTLRVQIVQALDHYPAGSHYRNCLRQAATASTVTVQPGENTDVQVQMTFQPYDMTRPNDIRLIAFAQDTGAFPNSLIRNGDMLSYPFTPPPPPVPGDVNHDGHVTLADLAVVLAYFGDGAGRTWDQGDFDGDGLVTLADLSLLLANFGT